MKEAIARAWRLDLPSDGAPRLLRWEAILNHNPDPLPLAPTVLPKGGRNVLAAAASDVQAQIDRDGGDPDEVLSRAGVDAGALMDGKNTLDLRAYVAMMEIAAKQTGNDNFGLDYGQRFVPERLGLIGAVVLAAPNLGSALTTLVDLFPCHQQATETNLVREGRLARLEYRIIDGGIIDRRQDAELTMGMFANILRQCLGSRWAPEELHYEHPRPEQWRNHERAFDAPAVFEQRTNAIVFDRQVLEMPMLSANLLKWRDLKQELRGLGHHRQHVDLVSRLKGEIRSGLSQCDINIEKISQTLAVPRWTLQRRLSDMNMVFSDVVDGVRKEMATHYLKQQHLSLTDIAFLLGYSELSAFSRACKRWYGSAPQQYRCYFIQ